jgi:hypothetical protein
MKTWIVLAGIGQIALALGSLAIPRVLGRREETRRLTRLTRQVFWTYSIYIWGTNVCMGALSALGWGVARRSSSRSSSRARCTRWRSAFP